MGVIIYCLIDPRTGFNFYVGKTDKKLFRDRIRNHLSDARNNKRTRCHRWIRGILAEGKNPEAFIIEEVSVDTWVDAEQFWIAYFRFLGCPLTNHTIGGEGLSGMKHSSEAIRKTADAHRGVKRTAETRANMRAAWTLERKRRHVDDCKAREIRPETRRKISQANAGKVRTDEFKQRVGNALRGRSLSDDHKRKVGAGISRAWTPERKAQQATKMLEVQKKRWVNRQEAVTC